MPGDVKEAPIGPPPAKKAKKYSARVKKAAAEYLQRHGLSIEVLTEPQQQAVLKFAKDKRNLKTFFILAAVMTALQVAALAYGYDVCTRLLADFMPSSFTVIAENGSRKSVELTPEDRDYFIKFCQLCAIFAGQLTILLYMGASCIGAVTASFFTIRRTRKTLDAFVPEITKRQSAEGKGDVPMIHPE